MNEKYDLQVLLQTPVENQEILRGHLLQKEINKSVIISSRLDSLHWVEVNSDSNRWIRTQLVRTEFLGSKFSNGYFHEVSFKECVFREVEFTGCVFDGCDFNFGDDETLTQKMRFQGCVFLNASAEWKKYLKNTEQLEFNLWIDEKEVKPQEKVSELSVKKSTENIAPPKEKPLEPSRFNILER